MPRKKKSNVETVAASEAPLVPKPLAANFEAVLDRMVRDRIEEVLADRGAALMEPDFQPKEIAIEILSHQTLFHRRKWTLYFEKWGCRGCRKKKLRHKSNGYCDRCHILVYCRLVQLERDFEQANPDHETERQIDRITSRIRSAHALLGKDKKCASLSTPARVLTV